jgi:uncharacterized membrane protein YbaN (DUF454 family)
MSAVTSSALRFLYLSLGLFFLGLGFIGIALPLIPTVVPILLAAFFFSKSSERFHNRLLEHRLFGGIVRDWRAGVGFTLRAKMMAIVATVTSFTISIVFVVDPTIIRVGLVALAVSVVVYLARVPTKEVAPVSA